MKRWLTYTPYFATLVLILALTLSFIHFSIAASSNSEVIVLKMKELQEDLSGLPLDEAFENTHSAKGQRKALANKIKAVINQIEAGVPGDTTPPNITSVLRIPETPNYDEDVTVMAQIEDKIHDGAVNKLENDLKNTVISWVTKDYEGNLIDKINEIIRLIKCESGVDIVFLSYSSNMVDWINLTMSLEGGLYVAEIQAQPYGTNVSYKVYAYDKAGNSAVSCTHSYLVIDSYPPMISWVERFLISPNYNDTVLVTARVSEPEEASGVRLAILGYSDGDLWINITMTLKEETIYEGSIPTLPYGTAVEYMVYASDNAESWVVSSTYSYIVGDEYLPTVRIDKPISGSYVKGIVEIAIFVYDDNFDIAELSISDTVVKSWASTGEYTYDWDTTTYIDGVYILGLTACDNADNTVFVENTVTVDNILPDAEIKQPPKSAYIRGTVNVVVYGNDTNFLQTELYIGNNLVETWTTSGEQTYILDTSELPDGSHSIKLIVFDKAGNMAEKTFSVTVDNTLPTAIIHAPAEGAFLKGRVAIDVTGEDVNFEKTELKIDDVLVKTWTTGGSQVYLWDMEVNGTDGAYTITLTVHDKAGNIREKTANVIVDITSPIIEGVVWTPKEPSTDEQVTVSVNVSDPQPSSSIKNVTLWYKNTTMDEWKPISMSMSVTSGNWTANIPAQSMETTNEFYIEAFDDVGNREVTDKYEYNVFAPAGIPLAWIVAVILLLLVATAAVIYFWRKRRGEKQSISGA